MNKDKLGSIIIILIIILIVILNGVSAGVEHEKLPKDYGKTVSILNIVLFAPALIFGTALTCGNTS